MRLSVNGRYLAARPTGVQRVARELVDRLARSTEVTLHVPRGAAGPTRGGLSPRPRPGFLAGPLWEQAELPLRRAREAYDVALDPANAGPRAGRRRVMILHDAFPLTDPGWYGPAFRAWYAGTVAPAARSAERVVMFSRWARDRAVEALGLDAARVRVVGQGVEPFHEPPDREAVRSVRARLDLPPRFVLSTGAGDPRKNAAFLRSLLPRLGDLPLVQVGRPYARVHGTSPEARSRRSGKTPGPGERVRSLGHVTDLELRVLYREASVFCFPSLAEGFGRPPLEAMAGGTPVVAADYGSAREVLGDAARVLPLDPEAWAEAVMELAEEGPARRRAVAAGLRRTAPLRWDRAAAQVEAVCREVAGTGAGRPAKAEVA